jgi:predicted RND superfamily exporter protein
MRSLLANLYDNLVLAKPQAVLFLLLCVFGFFTYFANDFRLDASADSLLLENDQALRQTREVYKHYGGSEFLFVTFAPKGDLFSDKNLEVIRRLRDDLKQVKHIASVTSLVDVPLLTVVKGTLLQLSKNYRTLLDKDVDKDKARKELTESPLFSQLIISRDGKVTALKLDLEQNPEFLDLQDQRNDLIAKKYDSGLSEQEARRLDQIEKRYREVKETLNEQNHRMIGDIRTVMSHYQQYGSLHLGGLPMIANDMIEFIKSDLVVFGLGVFVFMIAMLAIIFRQMRWVVLPLLSCVFSGLLMIGLLGFVGWDVTVISSNFIALMLILTMSMNIHLVVRYRQLLRDYPDQSQHWLVSETARKMVWPSLYTALTTMMGFCSLVFSDIKPVIDFGWMMTIGLGVAFVTSFLLFPCVLMLLNKRPVVASGEKRSPVTAALAHITERHGGKVMWFSVILAVVSLIGMSLLRVENSFVNYFSRNTEIYQGLKLIDDELGGTTTLNIILKFHTPPPVKANGSPAAVSGGGDDMEDFNAVFGDVKVNKADYWFTPEKIDLIKGVQDYLDSLPAVGKVLSLASTVRVAESLVQGQEFNAFEMAILYKRLPKALRASLIDPYVSLDRDEARITLRIKDSLPNLRRAALLAKIRHDLQTRFKLKPDQFQITGLLVLYNNMLQSLFKSQILTLGIVMLGIALMLLILFRSWKLAVIGIIPNILASCSILGLMGLAGIPLDMMTITIAAITIGIAVDDGIHYIHRFREELPRHNHDYIATLHYCHANVGSAAFYTSITIMAGFSILVLSNFIPTIYFGLLTALAMLLALLGALTLLPLLLLWWRPYNKETGPE